MIFYDIECFKYDWLIVFKENNNYTIVINDRKQLQEFIECNKKKIFVGFNNYNYDDKVVAGLLLNLDPYVITKRIIEYKEKVNLKLNLITLDVIQELALGVGLKSSQANLGLSIVETPIDFNLTRKLTKEEIQEVILYCKNDVNDTERLFKLRNDYFITKFDIIKEFNLPVQDLKKTRALLVSKVLECKDNIKLPRDRLNFIYDPNINFEYIPKEVIDFFKQCEYDFNCGMDYKKIENSKLKIDIASVPHVIGFGGLHGAIEKYNSSGTFLQIDVSSYYPSLMLNNDFISRKSSHPELYKHLYNMRLKLKKEGNPKQVIYKILLNACYGAMKSPFNPLYDPKQANNISINGQLILIQLIEELKPYCQLIQSNTDGILIKYNNNYNKIKAIVDDFGNRFNLKFDIDKIIKVSQRDVNNYCIQYENGKIKAKGRLSKFDKGNFEQNNLTIIDKALVNYYIFNIPIHETVIECYKNNDILPFQIVAKMGNTFDGMFYEYKNELHSTQKVNRVFATKNKVYGGIYKKKDKSYHKIANTSENVIIHNQNIEKFKKEDLDLDFYIDLCKKNLY